MSLIVTGRANARQHHERRAVRTARALDGRELRSPLLGGSATLSVTDERRSGAAMIGIRFPLSSGVDIRNINSANRRDQFSSTGNMALQVAGEIDALAALHCKPGSAVHRSSSGYPQRYGLISRASVRLIICTERTSRPFPHHRHHRARISIGSHRSNTRGELPRP